MSAITIGGDLIHYEKLGRGRPVILIHGWIGSWRYWIPVMQTLHLSFTVYTLDLIGFGDSAKNEANYSVDAQVKMLEQFMEKLGIPKAAMIGHGLGSLVLTQFALRNPTKAARLMLASLPLFDPGDLSERVPAGTRRLLTTGNTRYSLAPSIEEVTGGKMSDAPVQEKSETVQPTARNSDNNAADGASGHSSSEITVPSTATGAAASSPAPEVSTADLTIASGAEAAQPAAFHELPTISPTGIDRESLRKAAEERDAAKNINNQLMEVFRDKTPVALLERCFKKTETSYEKLKADVDKSDSKTLLKTANGYDAGEMLDDLRRLTTPVVAVHGQDDPVLPVPNDDIWHYLTVEKEDVFVPIPLPNVRHFPMLEHDAFARLAKDFLDAPDISKLEVRDIWKRRHF